MRARTRARIPYFIISSNIIYGGVVSRRTDYASVPEYPRQEK